MPERGEVWLVDFGITQKVRPALVVSVPYAYADRALLGVIPHTTATRGSRWEVPVPPRYFVRQLGTLSPEQIEQVSGALLRWLGLLPPNRATST